MFAVVLNFSILNLLKLSWYNLIPPLNIFSTITGDKSFRLLSKLKPNGISWFNSTLVTEKSKQAKTTDTILLSVKLVKYS